MDVCTDSEEVTRRGRRASDLFRRRRLGRWAGVARSGASGCRSAPLLVLRVSVRITARIDLGFVVANATAVGTCESPQIFRGAADILLEISAKICNDKRTRLCRSGCVVRARVVRSQILRAAVSGVAPAARGALVGNLVVVTPRPFSMFHLASLNPGRTLVVVLRLPGVYNRSQLRLAHMGPPSAVQNGNRSHRSVGALVT